MKIPITILLLASLFAASCGEPPMPPSDEKMIRHFATHEAAFYNPQIQISAESETKRSKKESAQHSKSRNKSFVMTSVSAL